MAVVVTKLEGEQIPEEMREASPQVLFRVTDVDGNAHYAQSDEEAAKLAVRLSEQNKSSSVVPWSILPRIDHRLGTGWLSSTQASQRPSNVFSAPIPAKPSRAFSPFWPIKLGILAQTDNNNSHCIRCGCPNTALAWISRGLEFGSVKTPEKRNRWVGYPA